MARMVRSNLIPLEADGESVLVRRGDIEDFHIISPETDAENLRLLGALGEMLLEQAKKSFRVNSLLVIAQNEDFRIVMFPRENGIAVWKTNLEVHELLDVLHQSKNGQEGKPTKVGRLNIRREATVKGRKSE